MVSKDQTIRENGLEHELEDAFREEEEEENGQDPLNCTFQGLPLRKKKRQNAPYEFEDGELDELDEKEDMEEENLESGKEEENFSKGDGLPSGSLPRKRKPRNEASVPFASPSSKSEDSAELYIPQGDYGTFHVKGHTLYSVKEDSHGNKRQSRVGNLVYIKEILHRTDGENVQVFLVLRFYYHSEWYEKKVNRSQLQVSELSKLMENGMDVSSHKVKSVAMFLDIQESEAPKRYQHLQLGWIKAKAGEELFNHLQVLGSSCRPSHYGGEFALEKGTLTGWEEVIQKEVIGRTAMEFALIAGLSSPVVSWIARDLDMEVLVIHAFGESTMGKTTAARLFVSPFGRPTRKDGGLILLWKATINALIAQISNNHGMPIAIDEASMNKLKDFTEVIYLLAEGKEKARLSKEIELRRERTWSGTYFSTAEHSLLAKSNQNSGLIIRLQEYGNIQWTEDAKHAGRILKGLLEHYGQAGPAFVRFIQEIGKAGLYQRVSDWTQRCLQQMEIQDRLSQRLAQKYALIMTTAELVNDCFTFRVNLDNLLQFMIQNEQKGAKGRDYDERAYDSLKGLVIQHRTKFARDNELPTSFETWGKIFTERDGLGVAFLKDPFREEMEKKGFDNIQSILSKWKEKGFLDAEAGKNTKKKKVPNASSRDVYYVRFKENFLALVEGTGEEKEKQQGQILGKLKTVEVDSMEDFD